MSASDASRLPSRLPLAAFFLLTVLGAAMRLWQARESLWLDELHTAWCALGSFAEVAPRAAAGNQSPLFFWLEWLLAQTLGKSELVVRLPSLIAGSLLPVALYWLIQRWTRQAWLGVLAAWLVIIDPVQIFYATEARPYALVELLAVLHVGLLAKLLDQPAFPLRLAFIATAALLFHLHYTAALLFPAEIAAVTLVQIFERKRAAYRGRDLALDFALVAVLCLPALPNLQAIYNRRGNWAAFVHPQPIWQVHSIIPWSASALVLAIALVIRRPFPWTGKPDFQPALLALAWLLVPMMIAWATTVTDVARLLLTRYLIASAPAAFVLVALCVESVPWRNARIAVGVVVAMTALALTPIFRQPGADGRLIGDRRGDWRAAIAHFNQQPQRNRYPVLLATQLIEADGLRGSAEPQLVAYCQYPVRSLYPIAADPANVIPLPRTRAGQLEPAVRDLVRSRGGAWLILTGDADRADEIQCDVRQAIEAIQGPKSNVQSQEVNWTVAKRHTFGTLHIMLLQNRNVGP